MKTRFLTLLLCGALAIGASAQETPRSGYETLIAAGKLILPGENGRPSAPERVLSPSENLRRQRLAVARNAPALKLMREALQKPIETPIPKDYSEFTIGENGRFRELARQLIQESDVRFADGNFAGALDSRLTILDLGVAISRGLLTSMLTGSAIESIGRRDIEPLGAKLDAPALRAAAARLAAIEARRPSFLEILDLERQTTLNLTVSSLQDPKNGSWLGLSERLQRGETDAETREMLEVKPEVAARNIARLFDAVRRDAALPFDVSRPSDLPRDLDALNRTALPIYENFGARFNYERGATQTQLLRLALELRAAKLESGAYPPLFATPIDRFSPAAKPLIYRSTGQSYALYSLGPDGKDDGGRIFKSSRPYFDRDSGTMRVRNLRGPQLGSKGDILAPTF